MKELQDIIKRTMARNGKIILPVFAVGRSQEVMIAIDEFIGLRMTIPLNLTSSRVEVFQEMLHGSKPWQGSIRDQ